MSSFRKIGNNEPVNSVSSEEREIRNKKKKQKTIIHMQERKRAENLWSLLIFHTFYGALSDKLPLSFLILPLFPVCIILFFYFFILRLFFFYLNCIIFVDSHTFTDYSVFFSNEGKLMIVWMEKRVKFFNLKITLRDIIEYQLKYFIIYYSQKKKNMNI